MPELPELEVYTRRLRSFLVGGVVRDVLIAKPFVLRTVDPPIEAVAGCAVTGVERVGKRLMMRLAGGGGEIELYIHLMRSGRLHWVQGHRLHKSIGCAEFRFDDGWSLQMTEASKQKQASINLFRRGDAFLGIESVGIDPLSAAFTLDSLTRRLKARNRQLKGALVDQSIMTGIGNAYSDEILFEARLSPLVLTNKITDEGYAGLHSSIGEVLNRWIARIDALTPGRLPTDQPAWRREFAVHGRFQKPCPGCGHEVARISFAESETNYCPGCQTGGKLLADRRMSKLFRR